MSDKSLHGASALLMVVAGLVAFMAPTPWGYSALVPFAGSIAADIVILVRSTRRARQAKAELERIREQNRKKGI